MLDKALFRLIISTLSAGMTSIGQTIPVQQSFQPTQQGVNTQPTLYLHKVSDERVGFPYRKDAWDYFTNAVFKGTISGTVLNLTDLFSGSVSVGQILFGDNIPADVAIESTGTGTGGVGTYNIGESLSIPTKQDMTTATLAEVHTESQQYATTFQLSALATQPPADATSNTASDWLNYAAYVLQSSATIAAFEAQGVGIQAIKEIRNPYFLDDRDQNEASPSFDFVLTHKQLIISTVPVLETEIVQIFRV